MPTLVFYTYLYHVDNVVNLTQSGKYTVLSLVFLTTCLIPVLTVLMFRYTKIIKDLQMSERKDRYVPFVFITIFYIVVTYLMAQQPWFNSNMTVVMVTMTLVVIITNVITFFWKISAHAAGIAGWLGFILVFSRLYANGNTLLWPLVLAILLNGLVTWSRLYLNAHKPKESIAGFALGFLLCYCSILFFV
jgi:membrane-associated phospholipid phosphatase